MNTIYWLSKKDGELQSNFRQFKVTELSPALAFAESIRKAKRNNEQFEGADVVGYITSSCENPDSVGQPGVDVTDSSYSWSKQHRGAGPTKD